MSMTAACKRSKYAHFKGFSLLAYLTDNEGNILDDYVGWWRGSVVERRSLAGELSLSCARPAADG